MPNWLLEIYHYSSTRTVIAFGLGIVLFIVIDIYGNHVVEGLEFSSPIVSAFHDAIQTIVSERYDKLAWGTLASFWGLAFTLYQKDKKRWERL